MDSASSDFFPPNHQPGLFRSTAWLTAWYETWGQHPTVQLPDDNIEPPTAHDLQHMIVRTREHISKIIPIINAFPLGLSTHAAPSIRSEYFFFSADGPSLPCTVSQYLDRALSYTWDQFYIPDILRSSRDYQVLVEEAKAKGLDVVHKSIENTYAIDTSKRDFIFYLNGLGKNTRLKLFNRRKNLNRLGTVKLENIWPDRTRFFYLLNSFHLARWGKECYRGKNLDFINRVLDYLSEQKHEVDFSVLSVDNIPISVVLDIRYSGRQYNIQSGYVQDYAKSISLGSLHFGYQIEAAFKDPNIEFYDFMAGKGKHADYKKSLVNRSEEFATLLLVRSTWLKYIYRARELSRRK